ncbi:MAG: bifunctional pyr operon transcriptional regulator/uracil phosphoribosyltransferase PyrR [Gammaproteobacteria bacterium]|nr:bifunctional pyr operon transcriptional regulator/uracil phosphoribosyltransferase PyrR [Gammaproteobacteria bacterium]
MPENNIDVQQLIRTLKSGLDQYLQEHDRNDPLFVGIHTGGVWIAQRLHTLFSSTHPLGALNIAFYRDDFSRIGLHPRVTPSSLPFDITGRHVILVDDVLYTGRTVRAAMNELFDYGRAASICLAVLVDRSGRELPIRADVTGTSLALNADQHIKLSGPDPLKLVVSTTA